MYPSSVQQHGRLAGQDGDPAAAPALPGGPAGAVPQLQTGASVLMIILYYSGIKNDLTLFILIYLVNE